MKRFLFTLIVGAVVAGFDKLQCQDPAAVIGIAAGLGFSYLGMEDGNSAEKAPEASQGDTVVHARKPLKPNSRIGIAYAAAGIASFVSGDPHFPHPFRLFYYCCIAVGLGTSALIAWQNRT